jgi:hypothetical protein
MSVKEKRISRIGNWFFAAVTLLLLGFIFVPPWMAWLVEKLTGPINKLVGLFAAAYDRFLVLLDGVIHLLANSLPIKFLVVLTSVGLMGCSSISFSSAPYSAPVATAKPVSVEKESIKPAKTPVAAPSAKKMAAEAEPSPVTSSASTYRHGRFTVEVKDGQQTVVGGVFMPPKIMPLSSRAVHIIFIDYTSKELMYYTLGERGYDPVIGYSVLSPSADALPKEVVRGRVTKIDENPSWCPTLNARKLYKNLPRGCLPPGHPLNAMGKVKFIIDWEVPNFAEIRLHGSKGLPEGEFWKIDTLGCTSLENKAILELVRLLGKDAVKEGIEVVLMKGNSVAEAEFLKKDSLSGLIDLVRTGR